MNPDVLEFWGNFLLAAARGQAHVEAMSKWARESMSGAMTGAEDFNVLFANWFGTGASAPEAVPQLVEAWEKLGQPLRASWEELAGLMGMVPAQKYEELEAQCRDLQEKLKTQVEVIHKLREQLHLARDHPPPAESVEELLRRQGDSFQQFVNDCMSLFVSPADKKGNEDSE